MHVLIVIIFKFGGISNNEQIDLYNKCHGEKNEGRTEESTGKRGLQF